MTARSAVCSNLFGNATREYLNHGEVGGGCSSPSFIQSSQQPHSSRFPTTKLSLSMDQFNYNACSFPPLHHAGHFGFDAHPQFGLIPATGNPIAQLYSFIPQNHGQCYNHSPPRRSVPNLCGIQVSYQASPRQATTSSPHTPAIMHRRLRSSRPRTTPYHPFRFHNNTTFWIVR